MKIFIYGSGGREHALAYALKINKDKTENDLYCWPSNAGIQTIAIKPDLEDLESSFQFILSNNFDLVVIGPEQYCAEGVADFFHKNSVPVFGPEKYPAQLETSKIFAKNFMKKYTIPTAEFEVFTSGENIKKRIKPPVVLKYDGLAAGKGVSVCLNQQDIDEFCTQVFDKRIYGEKPEVIAEECLYGKEVSVICAVMEDQYIIFPYARDHKRLNEQDQGPNTGGMGVVCSYRLIPENLADEIEKRIVVPTVKAMNKEKYHYTGFLFIGCILTESGPKVLEYNVRMGDPETEAIIPLMKGDFARFLQSSAQGMFKPDLITFQNLYSVAIIAASPGYPLKYPKDLPIKGMEQNGQNNSLLNKGSIIFHAGTVYEDNQYKTSGGRVFCVASTDKDKDRARKKSLKALELVKFDNMHFRRDIGV